MELRQYQIDLIDNIRKSINSGKKSVCAVLGCGGGKSIIQGCIAAMCTKNKNQVLFLVHRKELREQIESTFKFCGVDFQYCDVSMVQTVCRRLPKIKVPKLILVDEAHHILSTSYKSILNYFPNAVVCGFTATPQRMNEGGLGEVFQELIESVSTRWLIDNHFLTDYIYYGIELADTSKLHTKNGDFDKAEVEALMNKKAIFGSAVENWLKLAKDKKTIVYCSSIEISKATAKAFQDAGVAAEHLDGITAKEKRSSIVKAFRENEIKVLCNVDLFGEGFDVPDCEAVVLLRPTKSLTLHIQQSMRSMRIDPNNPDKVAIILDHVGNFTRHGLPDDEREWTLAQKAKKKKNEIRVKQCPVCFAVLKAAEKQCPICQHEFVIERKEVNTQVIEDIILQRISKKPYTDYKKCKSFAELDQFRKAKKFKVGWMIYKALELKLPIPNKYRWMMYRMGMVK